MVFGAQSLGSGMCVDLRSRQAGMSEHLLNAAQISAAAQHIGGEGVTQVVRRDSGRKPRSGKRLLEHLAHCIGAHLVTPRRDEEVRAFLILDKHWPRKQQVRAHARERKIVQRHDALLRPLAEHAALPLVEINRGKQQPGSLRYTRAACVQKLKQRLIAHLGGRALVASLGIKPFAVYAEQRGNVLRTKMMRQALWLGCRPSTRVRFAHLA